MNRYVFEPLFSPLGGNPLRKLIVPRRSGWMRLRCEITVKFGDLVCGNEGSITQLGGILPCCGA